MFLPPLANGSYEIAPVEVKIIAGKYFGPWNWFLETPLN
jgi:hypothetical protein